MPAKGTSPRERWNPLLKSYPDSEKVNAVSIGAETMFTRLIAKADDYGNYWATPRRLLAGLYSCRWEKRDVDETCMVRWRDELVTCTCGPLIALYSVSGVDYLHLINPRRRFRADVDPEELVPREPSNIEEKALSEHVTRTYRRRTADVPLDLDLDLDLDQEDTLPDFTETDSVIDHLNTKASTAFRHSDASRKNIHARLSESFTAADCLLVIDFKVCEWLGDAEWEKYLTPETLFRPTKFENNLNAAKRWDEKGRLPSKNGGRKAEVYETSFAASDARRRAKREAMDKEAQ